MSSRLSMVRNLAIVAVGSYVESGIGLLAGILIARALGPADYGNYAYAVWLSGVLISLINNALTTSSIKFLAELRGAGKADQAHILIFKLLRWQFLSNMVVLAGFGAYSLLRPMAEWQHQMGPMLTLVGVASWARAGFWLRGSISKGFELFTLENITLALTALINLVTTLVLAWMQAGVLAFFANYTALGVISNLLVRWMLHRNGLVATRGDLPKPLLERIHKHLLLTGVLIVFATLSSRAVEMTMLKEHAGAKAIAGTLSRGALEILAGGLSTVLLPSMARNYGKGGAKALNRILVESARLYWFIGLIIAGLGLTVASGLVHALYGARYIEAIPALDWQLLTSGLTVMNAAALAALTADDRQLARVAIVFIAFLFNLAVGYAFIPDKGLNGAIISSVLTQFFSSILVWTYTLRRTQATLLVGPMGRLLLVAVLATSVSWSMSTFLPYTWAFVPSGMVFCVLYLGLSVPFRTWRQSDFDIFVTLARKLGPRGEPMARRLSGWGQRFGMVSDEQT